MLNLHFIVGNKTIPQRHDKSSEEQRDALTHAYVFLKSQRMTIRDTQPNLHLKGWLTIPKPDYLKSSITEIWNTDFFPKVLLSFFFYYYFWTIDWPSFQIIRIFKTILAIEVQWWCRFTSSDILIPERKNSLSFLQSMSCKMIVHSGSTLLTSVKV